MARDTVASLLRGWRRARSYSVAQLAEAAEVGTTTIERIEAGQDVKLSVLVSLIRVLRIDDEGVRAILAAAGLPAAEGPTLARD